jgi:hypothetical protein
MHLLNSSGHVTIHWEPQNDEKVLPVIQGMLDKGYKFFILSAADQSQVTVTSVADVVTIRQISLSDENLQQLHDAGLLTIGGITIKDEAETTGELAKTPAAVAANETVVTKPAAGG